MMSSYSAARRHSMGAYSSSRGGASLCGVGTGSQQYGPQMHLDNWLSQRAATCPDRCAVIADGTELSYAELEREATAAARRLAARGVRRGATVALELPPGLEYAVVLHALMKLGAIAFPVNTRLAKPELDAVLASAKPALTIGALP